MTGMYEQVPPGIGHNQPDEYAEEKKHAKWERWAKKRTFVRALEGTYSHLYKALLEEKRVYSSQDVPWKGGPGQYGKHIISPQAATVTQSIETHIEAYAPGAFGQKHGHLNSAVFYVRKGRGHDVHDGRYIPCKAGDVITVREKARAQARIAAALAIASQVGLPEWVDVDSAKFTGTLKALPDRDQILPDINENLVVELYSK